jgi:hypothetical protein
LPKKNLQVSKKQTIKLEKMKVKKKSNKIRENESKKEKQKQIVITLLKNNLVKIEVYCCNKNTKSKCFKN